ncbi:5-(carboxyamino)imidazole ribonucleotide synthase [Pelagibacterium halotolerans]|uniref:N5-carboxyaminoimidazole ribonucleotide synthase n=1 Tax=Pelagibacterium halotolerans (strain DSM 22347 / JCM 15775 / CGMCC 1.7692 / B2) TaxID=1082931 RepID=G4R9X9_PELHB|nr:5-(carboxyamino)imidazole ribonucleotide synthase [Pelagibacterium halotolerans]AEQ52506.1 phosphoribosylaminoimidazole carboxylase ATPase subunit [Pelagibacterium halotolerans B2]QJR17772.1 5-(carboxyamino)imidazole ribonucleotide synthase [Pelagibacterium halotolerans]SEA38463.1 5-(carboxyamino)imidazole ribonucleotide synthase [Pelagibacterium halotolerans]
MTENHPLQPGGRIGILGGGQLGRMLSLAASQLGMKTHIFCPDPESPAFEVTPSKTIAGYDDVAALRAFAGDVDVVTYEFENVPLATAKVIADNVTLRPGAKALEVSQDRLAEKAFLSHVGIAVAPYRAVGSLQDLQAAISDIGLPAVLKTTRLGYDGKGQRMIGKPDDIEGAFTELAPGAPLVLEAYIPFEKEISVIVVRGTDGSVVTYDPAENVHRNHILKTSTLPATVSDGLAAKARAIAGAIAKALDYVGTMGVEFFVVSDGDDPQVLVNEIAPRVHNSGHWTQAVCVTDQFENHIRAICDWPLGDTTRLADVVMENLIGEEIFATASRSISGIQPHVYGKAEARTGRKMGHLNIVKLPRA